MRKTATGISVAQVQPIDQAHVFGGSLQITPEPATGREEMAELLEHIERQPEFVLLQKLPVLGQKCCMLLLVKCGQVRQSISRTLEQRYGNLPILDQLGA